MTWHKWYHPPDAQAPVPNPKSFNDDFVNTHVADGPHIMYFPHLQHGINHFKSIGCTKLVEQSLPGIVFTQMSAKDGLKKHKVLAKKALLKEFAQLNDMDVMEPLDLCNLSV